MCVESKCQVQMLSAHAWRESVIEQREAAQAGGGEAAQTAKLSGTQVSKPNPKPNLTTT